MSTNKPAEFNFYLNTQGPRGRQGAQGPQGVSPTITIGQNNTNSFTLVITDANRTFETPNLKGNLVDVSDNGSYVRYQPSDGTLYTSDLEKATTSTFGGVRFATEENLIDDISSGVAISPSDLQDYLAAKLTAGDNITITKDDETGIITIASTGGSSGGVSSYNDLTDKPELFGTVIQNDNTLSHYVPLKAPLKESVGVDYEQDIVIKNGTLADGMLTFADDWHPMFSDTYSSFTLQGEFTLNGNEFTPNSYASMPINVGDIIGFPGGTGADIACGHIRETDGQFIFTHLLRVDGLTETMEQSTENWANLHVTNKSASGSTLQCSAENGTSTWLSGKNITNGACYFQFRQDTDGSYVVVFIRQSTDGNSYGIKTVFSSDSAKADLAQLSRVFFGGTDILQNPQNQFFIYRNPGINLEDVNSESEFDSLTNMVNWQFPDAEHSLYVDYDNQTVTVDDNGKLTTDISIEGHKLTSSNTLEDLGAQKAFTVQAPLTFKSAQTGGVTLYGFTQSGDTLVPTAQTTVTVSDNTTYPHVTVTNGFTANITNQSWTPDCGILVPFTSKQMLMYDCTTRPFVFLGTLDSDGKFISSACIWMLDTGDVMRPTVCYNPTMGADTINYLAAFRNYNASTISGTANSIGSVDRAFINFGNYNATNNYSINAMGSNGSETVHRNWISSTLKGDLPYLENITHALIVGFDTSKGSIKASNFGAFAVNEQFSTSDPSRQPVAMMQDNPNLITIGPNSDTLGLNIDNSTIKVNENGQLYANINATDFQEKFTPVEPLRFQESIKSVYEGYSLIDSTFSWTSGTTINQYRDYLSENTDRLNSYDVDAGIINEKYFFDMPINKDYFYYGHNHLVILGVKNEITKDFEPIFVLESGVVYRIKNMYLSGSQVRMTLSVVNGSQGTDGPGATSYSHRFLTTGDAITGLAWGTPNNYYVTATLTGENLADLQRCNVARFRCVAGKGTSSDYALPSNTKNTVWAVFSLKDFDRVIPTQDEISRYGQLIPIPSPEPILNLTFNEEVIPAPYTLPVATTSTLGGVKPDGTTITATADGIISAVQADPYTLPVATTTTLGGVKPDGTTITVTSDGTITSVGGGTGGTTDYTALTNKPQINSVELTGNKSLTDIGAQAITDNTLTTTAKTIVGAINELVTRIAALETRVTSLNTVIDGQTGSSTDA